MPWRITAAQAIARGSCVRYEGNLFAFSTAVESPEARRASEAAAVKSAAEASRKFGATEEDIELARKTTEEMLLEQGIDISDM